MEATEFGSSGEEESVVDPSQTSEETAPVGGEEPQESYRELFLKEVDPRDRPILEKYVKQWDAGVTKKFQEHAEERKRWQQFGEYEAALKDLQFARGLKQADPKIVFRNMFNGLYNQFGDAFLQELPTLFEIPEDMMSDFNGQNMPPQYDDTDGEEIDPRDIEFQNMKKELDEFKQWKSQQETNAREQEEIAQLDAVISTMHDKYGDFDEAWVLTRLAQHGNVEKAMKEWNEFVGKISQGARRQVPKHVGGQGGVPSENVDTNKLRGKERRNLVAQMLESRMSET